MTVALVDEADINGAQKEPHQGADTDDGHQVAGAEVNTCYQTGVSALTPTWGREADIESGFREKPRSETWNRTERDKINLTTYFPELTTNQQASLTSATLASASGNSSELQANGSKNLLLRYVPNLSTADKDVGYQDSSVVTMDQLQQINKVPSVTNTHGTVVFPVPSVTRQAENVDCRGMDMVKENDGHSDTVMEDVAPQNESPPESVHKLMRKQN